MRPTNQFQPPLATARILSSQRPLRMLSGFLISALIVVCTLSPVSSQDRVEPKTLTAASNMLHPPFSSWSADGQAQGIEIDIVETAAKASGHQIKWVEMPFPELFDAIDHGKIDLAVSTIGKTNSRMAKVAFSEPYFETQIVALVKPDSSFDQLTDLATITIGADKSTTSFAAAQKAFPRATIVEAATRNSSWPKMVYDGTIDVFVVDASDQFRLESQSGLKLRRLNQPLATESFCVAFSKSMPQMKTALDKAIQQIKPTVSLRIGNEIQFVSPLGRQITSLKSPPQKLVDDYLSARRAFRENDVMSAIWFGRRAGYLQRINEAIEIYSSAIERFPNEPRLYRHRGHRYISLRDFDKAIADLEKAVELIDGKADAVEPDGAPNPQGLPLTTTQGNIWYHLGLAYYLKNDLENALRCFQQRVGLEKYDDNYVANSHWIYMICRRMGKEEQARQIVGKVRPDMRIIENMSYHKTCLFYSGIINEMDLETSTDGSATADVILYGLANWMIYHKQDLRRAKQLMDTLFDSGSPFSFAFIAAEADYARLFGKNNK